MVKIVFKFIAKRNGTSNEDGSNHVGRIVFHPLVTQSCYDVVYRLKSAVEIHVILSSVINLRKRIIIINMKFREALCRLRIFNFSFQW